MSVEINITENKYYPELTQEVTEIIAEIQTGYYPVGGGGDIDWDNIENKPTEFPPEIHINDDGTIRLSETTQFGSPGESLKQFQQNINTWADGVNDNISDFQNDLNEKVDITELANYYTKTESDSRYKSISYVPTWGEITGKPTNFNPTSHNSTHENGGTDQINGQNLFVEVIPSVVNYTPYFNTLKGHLNGIDSKLGEHSDFKAGILDGSVNPLLSRSAYAIVSQLDASGWAKQMAWVSHDDKRLHVADIETGQSHATLDDRDLQTFGVPNALIQFANRLYNTTFPINTGVFVDMQVSIVYSPMPRQVTLKFTINQDYNVLTARGYKLKINNTTSSARVDLDFATATLEGTKVLVLTFNDNALSEHTSNIQEFEIYKDGEDISGVPTVNWINEYKQDKLSTITGNVGVGKTDASATEKLDVAGRVKSDGLVLNETTSAILPKEIKLKDGKIKAALNDGVEKAVLLEGDVSGFDFNALVDIFQYSNFQFIRPSFNTTNYFQYANDGANVFQTGHVAYNNINTYQIHGIQYKSATTTLGRVHGNFRGYIEKFSYSSFNTSVQFAITSNIETQRVFVGYSDKWRQPGANPTNVAMNTLIDVIGVCMESGSSNLFIIHNDATGTANLIDTGFTHNTNYLYILRISKKVNTTTINVVLERIDGYGVKTVFNYDITNDYVITGCYLAMYCIDALGATETSFVDFGSLKTKRLNYLA